MASSAKPNASGLMPSETKALPERTPEHHEQSILKAIRELYSCKPTSDTYNIYAENAVFHDPVGIANGKESIMAQFNALVKLFPKTEITTFRVLDSKDAAKPRDSDSNKLLIDQTVAYFRPNASSPTKTVNSLLTLELDSNTKHIVKHTEEWDHKTETTSENGGFLGMLNEARKKATAAVTDFLTDKTPPSERK